MSSSDPMSILRATAISSKARFFTKAMVIVMSALSQSACSASDTFEITREVLLREGREPRRIIRVEDGYIIVGSGRQGGTAIKTDLQGKKTWSFFLPHESEAAGPSEWPIFTGVVALQNGNTLLCGYQSKAGEGIRRGETLWGGAFVGLLIRLDSNGRLLDKREVFPHGDSGSRLNYIQNCVPLGDGAVVLGTALGFSDESKNGHWMIGLSAEGEIQWEKIMQPDAGASVPYGLPVMLPGGIMVPLHSNTRNFTQLIRIDANGEITAQQAYQETLYTVLSEQSERTVQLLAQKPTKASTTLMVTLDENLQELSRAQIKANAATIKYRLVDGSYVLFDLHDNFGGAAVPSIQRVSADLVQFREAKLKPEAELSSIRDAVPTGMPGEFAVVRQILHGFDNKTSLEEGAGIGLQIVKIK
ncbi:MAG: hypothetical protein AB7T07_02790 [Steroidobacteraceae bacterium]